MLAKRAHEDELRKYGKYVRHYHSNNGTYAVAKCNEEIEENKNLLPLWS